MEATLVERWEATVRRGRGSRALLAAESGRSWTRAELAKEVAEWRAALPEAVRMGLPGQRVVLAVPNGIVWWTVFLGLLSEGAIPVALDATEPVEAQRTAAKAVGATWWWYDGRMEGVGERRAGRGRDLCLLKLTSGSTGTPRALVFTHAQMIADGTQICATMGIGPADVNLGIIPFGHSYGLGNLVLPLILQGTQVVMAESPLPQALAAACARGGATVFATVPAILKGMVRASVEREKLATLRLVISAGAPLAADVAAEFFKKYGRRVHAFYGTSETGGICFDRSGEAALGGGGEGVKVGAPLEGVRLHWRQGGRFAVESAAVRGNGKFSPPDRAEIDATGEVTLLGRTRRMVKIGGRRLELGEIEAALKALPGVRETFATAHPTRADALAVVVAADADAAVLKNLLRAKVASWEGPGGWVVVREFPITARGKPDMARLRALVAEEPRR
ncbi:MAG: acyl--CoA ligase [Undibacterium sp.]|nr:acyl--CoA ligase [Opitutaceae bacterium]